MSIGFGITHLAQITFNGGISIASQECQNSPYELVEHLIVALQVNPGLTSRIYSCGSGR
jgi:hypothetical protein